MLGRADCVSNEEEKMIKTALAVSMVLAGLTVFIIESPAVDAFNAAIWVVTGYNLGRIEVLRRQNGKG
jgi:hypothetical protein